MSSISELSSKTPRLETAPHKRRHSRVPLSGTYMYRHCATTNAVIPECLCREPITPMGSRHRHSGMTGWEPFVNDGVFSKRQSFVKSARSDYRMTLVRARRGFLLIFGLFVFLSTPARPEHEYQT